MVYFRFNGAYFRSLIFRRSTEPYGHIKPAGELQLLEKKQNEFRGCRTLVL